MSSELFVLDSLHETTFSLKQLSFFYRTPCMSIRQVMGQNELISSPISSFFSSCNPVHHDLFVSIFPLVFLNSHSYSGSRCHGPESRPEFYADT